jgi:hypothetical protein
MPPPLRSAWRRLAHLPETHGLIRSASSRNSERSRWADGAHRTGAPAPAPLRSPAQGGSHRDHAPSAPRRPSTRCRHLVTASLDRPRDPRSSTADQSGPTQCRDRPYRRRQSANRPPQPAPPNHRPQLPPSTGPPQRLRPIEKVEYQEGRRAIQNKLQRPLPRRHAHSERSRTRRVAAGLAAYPMRSPPTRDVDIPVRVVERKPTRWASYAR